MGESEWVDLEAMRRYLYSQRRPEPKKAAPIQTRREFARPNFRPHPLAAAIRLSLAMGRT